MVEIPIDGWEARRPEQRGRSDLPASRLVLCLVRLVVDHAVDLVKLRGLVIITGQGSCMGDTALDDVTSPQEGGSEVLA